MRFAYAAAALVPVALASPFALETRGDNAATILQELQGLQKDIVALNTTLNGLSESAAPSGKQEVAVENGSNKLTNDIKAITSSASSSTAFTVTESQTLFNYINSTIQASTLSLLQNFVNHQPAFNKGGIDSTVKSGLTSQKGLVQKQAAALTAKSQQPYKGEAPTITNNIIAGFNAAISAFS